MMLSLHGPIHNLYSQTQSKVNKQTIDAKKTTTQY